MDLALDPLPVNSHFSFECESQGWVGDGYAYDFALDRYWKKTGLLFNRF